MNKKKEPLLHISKRANLPVYVSLLIKAAAIVLSLLLCAVVITAATGENPLAIFQTMIKGSFGTKRKLWIFLQNTALLLLVSLAVTPAFKMRCWNLGAEGQVLVGCLATAACMIKLGNTVSPALLYPMMVISAVAAGAVWALLPACFKAKWNTNETLFTLMMNYVATQLVSYFVKLWENPKGSNTVGVINQKSRIGWMPEVYNKQLLSILIVIGIMLFMYFYLRFSKHGFEISVVGESERTARYIGIKVEKVILRTMILSGAIAGLMGFLLVSGVNHTISTTISGGRGFTGVMISWMSKFNPFVMVLSSALLTFMEAGATDISTTFGLNQSFSDILTGIIIFFIIGSEFFINYKINLNKHIKEAGK